MKIITNPLRETWDELLARPAFETGELRGKVAGIINEVRRDGDDALRRFALQFDRVELADLLVGEEEFAAAAALVDEELKSAIAVAKANIEKFHAAQKSVPEKIETSPGVFCWRKSVAIEKVGLYIPAGTAPLFSTVLMLAAPAQIAGCREIVLCSPCGADGRVNAATLYAARECGVTKVFKIGGAQAIAAMAYGTASVPRVYKIFGPGNQFVTEAKMQVSLDGTAIDMPAGPSEVAVYADETSVPEFVAADLLSQAEHGVDSQVLLVSTSDAVVKAALVELERQLAELPRREIAAQALENSTALVVRDVDEAVDLLNEYAAEHLILATDAADEIAERVVNAGSVFIGNFSCESAGDYASGTNHTLPTNGYARSFSGVSLDSFVKKITFQKLTAEGIASLGPSIETLAEAEQLRAHRNAITVRLASLEDRKS